MLDGAERRRLLVEWNQTESPYPQHLCVHQLFEEQAGRTPEAVALVSGDTRLTYAELNERANRLAHYLRESGVGPEARVGVLMERSAEAVVSLLAILKAGGAYVPLDPRWPAGRLALVAEDTGMLVVVTQRRLRERLGEGAGEAGAGEAGGAEPWRRVRVVSVDEEGAEIGRRSGENPESGATPDNLAYVIYTSGSTGRPKGVSVVHRNVVRLVKGNTYASMGPEETFLLLAPVSFDASTFEIWGALLNGARLAVMPDGVPSLEDLARALENYGVTTLWLTAGLFHQMVEHRLEGLGGLKQLLAGGDVLSSKHVREVLRRLPGVRVINGYGPTEGTTFTCCHAMSDEGEVGANVSIGRPIANTQVYVLDGRMEPVALGEEGELYIGGDGLGRGYLNRAGLTAERFVPHPFGEQAGARLYRTGDRVRYLPDGRIEFLGRSDRQVKIRGFRIEPGEVEAALREHPEVEDAAVVVFESGPEDKRLVAYVTGRGGAFPPAGRLRGFLRDRLPEQFVPSAFVALRQLPLTANGKVDRDALPAPGRSRPELEAPFVAARTPVEEALAGVWEEVIGVEPIGVHDDFFELGGHSLKATQIVSRLRNALDVDLPLQSIFEAPTIAGLAERIEADGRGADGLRSAPELRPMKRDGEIPLSFSQERIWFLQRFAPDSRAYNFQATLRFKGRLDAAALERGLSEIVRRHEILRTTFPEVGGRPIQVIYDYEPLSLPVVEVEAGAGGDKEAALQRLIREDILRPFDLAELPLMRWTLYRLGEEEHVLLHIEHHLLHDGWSFNVFLEELFELYKAFSKGEPSPLKELPIQFADFAMWQRQWMAEGGADAQVAYWREKLAGDPGVLALPLDYRRPPVQTFRGRVMRVSLPPELGKAVREFSRREGVSLFMTMLTAFLAMLHRYTGQDDLWVGNGIANRRWRETEGLIGMIINNVVSRTDLSGNPTFRELLRRVRETTLEAYANQDVPFEKVVEAVRPARGLSYNPLFQVSFSFHDSPLPDIELPGLEVSLLEGISNGSAKFDVNVIVIPRADWHSTSGPRAEDNGLTLMWEYNTDLFSDATGERMVRHYRRMLENVVAEAGQRVAESEMLDEAERQTLLAEWNQTEADFPRGLCAHQLFEEQAGRTPEAVAVEGGGLRLTYRELNERANRLAHYLRESGVGPEARVGVLMERSAEVAVGLLGVLKAGGAYVPLDPQYPAERLAFMLEDAGAEVLLTHRHLDKLLPRHGARVVHVDDDAGADGAAIAGRPATNPRQTTVAENLAYVIYTSGSTGRPKGVAVQHAGLVNLSFWYRSAYGLGEGARVSQVAGLSFDASGFEIWPALTSGAALAFVDDETRAEPARVLAWLKREGITHCFLPTPLAEAALREEMPEGLALKYLMTGGDVLHQYPEKELPFTFVNNYGPTENTIAATAATVASDMKTDALPPIGRPIANTQAYILDSALLPAPQGVSGHLYLGGGGLARGYLARPALTAERFIPNPFSREPGSRLYRTGDLARYLPSGEIEFLGRADDQVKIRGFRIELGEVESVLSEHESVGACVVVAQDDPAGQKRLVAYVAAGGGGGAEAVTGADLKRYLAGRVPEYMVPAAVVVMSELPLTANGKVDRRALPRPEEAGGAGAGSEYEAPRSEVEAAVADIWGEVLRAQRPVGVTENFFELGGHSLLAGRILSRVRETFRVDLPLRSLFETPTVEGLAGLIEETLIGELEGFSDEQARQWLEG